MAKMIFVNLPVADVEKSTAFYEAIGFTKDERFSQSGSAAAMTWSDTIFFMILSRERFADFTSKTIIDARSSVEALLCLSRDSRAEVDAIVEAARAAGEGRSLRPARPWLYVWPQLRRPRRSCLRADVDGRRCCACRHGQPSGRAHLI
jgi:predicted lactoylglutathione lyase